MTWNKWYYSNRPFIIAHKQQSWTYPNPSMLQTTRAAVLLNPSSHTVPQVPLWLTSRRPSLGVLLPTNLATKVNLLNEYVLLLEQAEIHLLSCRRGVDLGRFKYSWVTFSLSCQFFWQKLLTHRSRLVDFQSLFSVITVTQSCYNVIVDNPLLCSNGKLDPFDIVPLQPPLTQFLTSAFCVTLSS